MRHSGQEQVSIDGRMNTGAFNATNERGIALVVALIMLAIIGLLGAFALNTTTTELHIAGNYRNEQFAYYNANMLQAYGPNNSNVNSKVIPYVNSNPSIPPIPFGPYTTSTGTTYVWVQFLCTSPPPPSMGADPDIFSALHYLVTIEGKGLNGRSEFTVETEMIMLGPKNNSDC
jgi:hypothetical protein